MQNLRPQNYFGRQVWDGSLPSSQKVSSDSGSWCPLRLLTLWKVKTTRLQKNEGSLPLLLFTMSEVELRGKIFMNHFGDSKTRTFKHKTPFLSIPSKNYLSTGPSWRFDPWQLYRPLKVWGRVSSTSNSRRHAPLVDKNTKALSRISQFSHLGPCGKKSINHE